MTATLERAAGAAMERLGGGHAPGQGGLTDEGGIVSLPRGFGSTRLLLTAGAAFAVGVALGVAVRSRRRRRGGEVRGWEEPVIL